MEYIGEYSVSNYKYYQTKTRILFNKSNTSWIIFSNGIKNKVYYNFNINDMFINCPINKNKKIKIIINHNITDDDHGDLIMYNRITDAMIQAEIENHFDNYEPHDF